MHVVSPDLTTVVKGQPPPAMQTSVEEDQLFALTDAIAEQEDVPIEYAYRLACLRMRVTAEATDE